MRPRRLLAALPALPLAACGGSGAAPAASPAATATPAATAATAAAPRAPRVTPRVVGSVPHDPQAFTQGLVWHDGRIYESTGLYGQSDVRETDPATGAVLRRAPLAARFFAEGLAIAGGRMFQLTWRERTAIVRDRRTLRRTGAFTYAGEGWGLATLGRRLVMSDGTAVLRVVDPATFRVVRRIRVRDGGAPVVRLNELEVVHGRIWANVWQRDDIVVIDPRTGRVVVRIDLSGLRGRLPAGGRPEVLNGIAWDRRADRVLVTGKWWQRTFVLAPPPAAR